MLAADGKTGWGKGGEQEHLLNQPVKRGAVASPSRLRRASLLVRINVTET